MTVFVWPRLNLFPKQDTVSRKNHYEASSLPYVRLSHSWNLYDLDKIELVTLINP